MIGKSAMVRQFRQPHGGLGHLAGWIMAHRGSNRTRNLWTVNLLRLTATDRVLEIGFGPGVALKACAEQVMAGTVVGIDPSSVMQAQATRRLDRAGLRNRVTLYDGPVTDLGSAQFTKVFSVNLIQFHADKAAFFAEVLSVLEPGGIIATTYMPRLKSATADGAQHMAAEIESAQESAGFETIERELLDLKPVPAICVLGRRPAE